MGIGVSYVTFPQTYDLLEILDRLQVNHLSPWLFIFLFLPYLARASADSTTPRVVFLGSEGHYLIKQLIEPNSPKILGALNDVKHSHKDV